MAQFDVVVTFEEWVFDKVRTLRVFALSLRGVHTVWAYAAVWRRCRINYLCRGGRTAQVVDDLQGRDSTNGASVLVVNLEVKDNAEEAALAAPQALELCQMLEGSDVGALALRPPPSRASAGRAACRRPDRDVPPIRTYRRTGSASWTTSWIGSSRSAGGARCSPYASIEHPGGRGRGEEAEEQATSLTLNVETDASAKHCGCSSRGLDVYHIHEGLYLSTSTRAW
jgi:hypothetical protein